MDQETETANVEPSQNGEIILPDADSNSALPVFDKIYSGVFNGFGVEIKDIGDILCLSHLGAVGKGSLSRSVPHIVSRGCSAKFIRQRQHNHRQSLWNIFANPEEKINSTASNSVSKVSENVTGFSFVQKVRTNLRKIDNDIVIVVPDSDSDNEDYFEDFKPKCCISIVNIKEKLVLSLQEAYFFAYAFGCLQIHNIKREALTLEESWKLFVQTERGFIKKYVVYHYFTTKGYIVKPGIKFGGDFVLYKYGPMFRHAEFIVVIRDEGSFEDWTAVLGHMRLAGTAVKKLMAVEVHCSVDFQELEESPEKLNKCSVREILLRRMKINKSANN